MAKRISLRDFQAGLTARLSEAKSGATTRSLLGLQAGNEYWLIDLTDSAEIIPVSSLTEVPLTSPWFAGMTNVRGSLYSVTDLSAFEGGELTMLTSDARLLLPHARFASNGSLLISRVLGLRNPDELLPVSHEIDENRPWAGELLQDPQGQQWRRLLLRPLLTHSRFLDIAA